MTLSTSNNSKLNTEEEVSFTDSRNQLFGVLEKPLKNGPHPAIVLLHGSERKGVDYYFYKDHSRHLVESNYAVLRYDSPGVGKSTGSIIGENLDQRAKEAVSAVEYLQSRDDIVPNHVGLWGHSQGDGSVRRLQRCLTRSPSSSLYLVQAYRLRYRKFIVLRCKVVELVSLMMMSIKQF